MERPDRADLAKITADLADIWSTLLAVESVSEDDDFFKLGGDSLMAATLTAHLEEAFGVYVETARLFENPRLADFARVFSEALLEDVEEGVL